MPKHSDAVMTFIRTILPKLPSSYIESKLSQGRYLSIYLYTGRHLSKTD